MSTGWENFKPAPIEVFHGEICERFHEVTRTGLIDAIQFNNLLAEFKTKIMNEYGITSDAIPIEKETKS